MRYIHCRVKDNHLETETFIQNNIICCFVVHANLRNEIFGFVVRIVKYSTIFSDVIFLITDRVGIDIFGYFYIASIVN